MDIHERLEIWNDHAANCRNTETPEQDESCSTQTTKPITGVIHHCPKPINLVDQGDEGC
jgi:hypothetical protein